MPEIIGLKMQKLKLIRILVWMLPLILSQTAANGTEKYVQELHRLDWPSHHERLHSTFKYPDFKISLHCGILWAFLFYFMVLKPLIFYVMVLKPTWRSKAVVWRKSVTNIVDESEDKLHDVLRCGLTVIQFHTPDRKEKKAHLITF